MPLFMSLLNSADASPASSSAKAATNLNSANTEMIAFKAQETAASGIFPLEVAFVVLGCLVATGFLLLMREARIDQARY